MKRISLIVAVLFGVIAFSAFGQIHATRPLALLGRSFPEAFTFSPNGDAVLLAGGVNAHIIDIASLSIRQIFVGHADHIGVCAYSPDAAHIVTGDYGGTVKLWHAGTGLCLQSILADPGGVVDLAMLPDNSGILSVGRDGMAKLWDAATGELIQTYIGHADAVSTIACSPDGTRVVTGSIDHTVKIWDTLSGTDLLTFTGHSSAVLDVAFSPDGREVLSGAMETLVRRWNPETGEEREPLGIPSKTVAQRVGFSVDGSTIMVSAILNDKISESSVRLWEAANGKPIKTVSTGFFPACTFSPFAESFLCGNELIDVQSESETTIPGAQFLLLDAVFSPDGSTIAAGVFPKAVLWDVAGRGELMTFETASTASAVAISPDGTKLATGDFDEKVQIWNVKTGALEHTCLGHTGSIHALAFSHDGSRLVSGAHDRTARLWDVSTGQHIRTFSGSTDFVLAVAFHPANSVVLMGSSAPANNATIRSVATGAILRTFSGHRGPVYSAVFSRDGLRVLTGSSDRTAKLWNASNGELIDTFEGAEGRVYDVAFTPDELQIATSHDNGEVRIWDVDSRKTVRVLHNPNELGGSGLPVAFSPDGRLILFGAEDDTIRIWTNGDCNENEIDDVAEITDMESPDCDEDELPDDCEADGDGDGLIDGCDYCPGTVIGLAIDELGCPVQVRGDLDRDGDVDEQDAGRVAGCLSGPDRVPLLPICRMTDGDGDQDVDLREFRDIQLCYSGGDIVASLVCAVP